jgi:ankyrin repeat protein
MAQKLREPKIIHKIREFFHKPEPDNSATLQERLNADLLKAAAGGQTKEVETLLEKGAEWWATSESGFTALMFAAGRGHARVCGLLVEHGASIDSRALNGSTPLMLAAGNGKSETCALLIEKGAAVNAVNEDSSNGWTALHWAAINGHTKACAVLVAKGAKIMGENGLHEIPELLAERQDKRETAAFLRPIREMWYSAGNLDGANGFAISISFFGKCIKAA